MFRRVVLVVQRLHPLPSDAGRRLQVRLSQRHTNTDPQCAFCSDPRTRRTAVTAAVTSSSGPRRTGPCAGPVRRRGQGARCRQRRGESVGCASSLGPAQPAACADRRGATTVGETASDSGPEPAPPLQPWTHPPRRGADSPPPRRPGPGVARGPPFQASSAAPAEPFGPHRLPPWRHYDSGGPVITDGRALRWSLITNGRALRPLQATRLRVSRRDRGC